MPVEVIPFSDLVDRASLNNPVFKAAGINVPATPTTASKPAEISFDQIQSAAPAGEVSLGDVVNVDSFPRRTSEDLAADEKFNPTQYFAQNPDVANDPAQLAKLLAAYRAKREKGITPAVVGETVKAAPGIAKKFGKGVYQLGSNIFQLTGLQAITNELLGAGETPQVREELRKESLRNIAAAPVEIAAGTETAATGLADLARTGIRKLQTNPALAGTPIKDKTDQELLQDLSADVEFQKQLAEVGRGGGEALRAAGLDADNLAKVGIKLEPDAIENLSLVDPVTMIAFGGGFKLLGVGGKLLATVPTVAKGAELVEKLGAAIPKIIGGAVTKAGTAVPKVAAIAPPVVGLAKGGPFGLVSGFYAAERLAPKAAKVGEAVESLGQQIAGNEPRSAALQNIIDAAKSPIVTSPIKGAAAGTLAAVPLAAAAEGNEQAGAILGGGAALGTIAGGLHGTKAQIGEFAASRLFDPHTVKFAPVESPAYGVDAGLDAANAKQLSKLSVNERGAITNFREAFRPLGAEIYTVDKPTYVNGIVDAISRQEGRPATPAEIAEAQQQADTQGFFDYNRDDGRRVVVLNGDLGAILHEPGHLFDSLLSPEKKAELVTAVRENYSPEQISALKSQYEKRFGQPVSDQYFLNELIAENFSAIFNNVPVTELTAPPGFLKKLAAVVGEGAEALGIDLTRGRTTPKLNVPVSFGLRKIFENAAREVAETESAPGLPVPGAPAAAPAAPTPVKTVPTAPGIPAGRPAPPAAPLITPSVSTAPNIRVTRGQQDAFARRAQETGVTEAKSLAAKSGDAKLTQRVNSIANFMESGNPVLEIEHRGIVSEGVAPEGKGRSTRRAERESGYAELERLRVENRANAPESVVNTHQKTFVPVRWTEQGNTPTLIAMSLDKVISNVHRIVKSAADHGAESLIPYESQQGRLTEAGWNKVVSDAQAYAENQSNGFRGDGQRLTRPTEDVGLSIPAENPDYRPQPLGEVEANFQNLIQGLATPETAREIKGAVPGNVKGQILAEANVRPLETPAGIKPKNVSKQEFKSFPGRQLQEVNPLRNELVRRGVDVRQLIEVTERIRAKDIASVAPRQDLKFKAPVTDIIRGGFLPSNKENFDGYVNQVANADAAQFRELAKKWGGGFTSEAWRVGREVTSPEQVATLKRLQTEQETAGRAALASGDFDAATPAAFKGQFFREAWEAATGEGSAGNALRQREPGYKPPFPTGKATPQFLPRTAKGAELSKEGFDFRISGQPGSRGVTVLKDGVSIGELTSKQVNPKEAEISLANLSKSERGKGVGEAAYRELLTQLKDDGVKEVGGSIVAPEPLAIRRKIFGGDFKKLERNLEPVSVDDALASLNELRRGSKDLIHVEAVNEIRPDSQFLPADKFSKELDPIKSAAIKTRRGSIITGTWHGEALDSLVKDARTGRLFRESKQDLNRIVEDPDEAYRSGILTDGFVTTSGKFLDRVEALTHAEKIGQLRPESESLQTRPDLEAVLFDQERQFLPKKKERDLSKYNVEEKKSTTPELTGWLQPDKKFTPLSSNRHEQFLAENSAELNKKFGTEFSGTPDVEERLAALNAGFVRFRGDTRTGGVHVELNSKFWPKFKSQIADRLLSDPESVDSVDISLLNDKGNVVDSTATGNLFSTEGTARAEKIQGAIDEIRSGARGGFLPAEEQTFKGFEEPSPEKKAKLYIARRRARAADNTPEALPPKYARDEDGNPVIGQDGKPKPITVDYNLIESPLAKEAAKGLRGAEREKAAAEAIGDQLVKAYKAAAKNPEIEAGSKWYSTARVRLKKLFGDDSKFFAELLGATSARTPVETNFRFALDAYNRFKAGDYDAALAKYREGKQAWENGEVKDFVKDTGNENPTRGQFLDWWVDQNNLSPVQSNGKKFGANSRAVLRVLDGSWQSEVKGPKTPNFAGNLTGATFEATVDVWAARALHRLANLKNEGRWRILPENETGVTDADFYLGQAAYRHAAEKLGIKPDALQAVLWFAEKNHWEKAGWTRGAGAEKSDFNSLLSETEKVAPGEFRKKTPQKELFGKAEIKPKKK